MTKQCTKCGERKSFSAFHKLKSGKYGLHPVCKKCRKIYDQKYYQDHQQQCLTKDKEYRETIIGCLHGRFTGIKHRCNNLNNINYKNYGGRGIKCLFENADKFVDYIINELQIDPRGLQIDRIDNNGHYEPGNIRFVTRSENQRNKRKNIKTASLKS